MGFDVSNLSAWVTDNNDEMLTAMVAKSSTIATGKVYVREGVVYKEMVPFFSNELVWQTGACVDNPTGGTSFTSKEFITTPVTSYMEYCMDDFNEKFLQKNLKPGSYQDESSFPQVIANNIVQVASKDIEMANWGGNVVTGSATGLMDKYNGWIQKLKNTAYSSSTVNGATATGFTVANAVSITDSMVQAIPSEIAEEQLTLFLPRAQYNILKVAIRNAYLNPVQDEKIGDVSSFTLPGYDNITVQSTLGLSSIKAAILTFSGNLAFATDLMSDFATLRIGFDEKSDKVYTRLKAKFGTEIFFEDMIVTYYWS